MESEGSSSSSVRSEGFSGPVLVTGAGGYLGGRVIAQLRARGVQSVGLARGDGSDVACNLLDAGRVRSVVDRTGPRVVVHCAAAVPRNSGGYDDAEAGADSVRMVRNLVDAGVANIVFASSMTVYPPGQTGPLREERADPQSAYGRAKLEAEALLAAASGCSAVSLRLPGLFGPPRRNGLVYALCEAVTKGRTPTLPAQPLMWSAMHVDDAASTVVQAALRSPGPGFVTNVGYAGALSVSLLVQRLRDIAGAEIEYSVSHPSFEMDLGTLQSTLGLPQGDLGSRLSEMLEYAAVDVV
jgi:nucleoside-diphosphate-sugar epimerase